MNIVDVEIDSNQDQIPQVGSLVRIVDNVGSGYNPVRKIQNTGIKESEKTSGAIRKDKGFRAIYEKLKLRRGAKKAILAVVRRLMGRIRSCLMNNRMYQLSEA